MAVDRMIAEAGVDEIRAFLPCPTPDRWLEHAVEHVDHLLIDHANCEKKAAATAMNLLYRYTSHVELLRKMSQLAREELLHFEQVVDILRERGIAYEHLSASRYAGGLREGMRKNGEDALIDTLLIGALVEARSCERFACLAPLLDAPLGRFYAQLLRSESRHYRDYLTLARLYASSGAEVEERLGFFLQREQELIESPDTEFRFHSGVPPVAQSTH
ncbi:MAG: tRNA-(ms[2]io[6]A)-hydroxylase [Pseudohongiellaceae bacterium]